MKLKKLLALLLALLMVFGLTACAIDEETVELAADVALALMEEAEAAEEAESPFVTEEEISDKEPQAEESIPEELPAEEEPAEETPIEEEPIQEEPVEEEPADKEPLLDEYGSYTTKEDVALYIYTYGCLPANFMTKNEARDLGWEGGGLDPYADGMCIGGDRFGNHEGILPDAKGRKWTECDIDTLHAKSRGAKRIVFSNDGLIYYTDDHYETFELLYGEE